MKVILTVTMVVWLGCVTGPCSSDDKPRTISPNVASPSPTTSDSYGLTTIPYDEMLGNVAGLAKQAGIVNLKVANLPNGQMEIRVWKAFGLAYPRCIVLVIMNGNARASFVAPKANQTKAVFRNGNPVYADTPLNAPHSGWDSFFSYLKEHGIGSSIELALDKRYVPYPDGEELIIEMKNGSLHTMAYYNDSTTSVDGKKAFDVCKQIRNEFDVNLGCP
ncbi:MAG TPA: hypothetical protein VLB68_14675 [Pyrinomonadaceae bacterium]|nr:hypothetical protein [Pyrinomonadaceae bacterium]